MTTTRLTCVLQCLVCVFTLSLQGAAKAETRDEAGIAAYQRGDFGTALLEFKRLAEHGKAYAQHNLGNMYLNGQGVPKDERLAAFWYRKAADQGLASAQFELGGLYVDGRGVPKDEQQAAVWYRKAARQGNAGAQNNLGVMYSKGQGVPKDEQQAVVWLRNAADQGVAVAQSNLGERYANGQGVTKDAQQAVAWLRKAADQGDAHAQNNLGVMYISGQGVTKDAQQAYLWWLLASAQGNDDARESRDTVEQQLSVAQRAEAQAAARNWRPKTAENSGSDSKPFATTPSTPNGRATNPYSTGSGFSISRTLVLTNAHVVDGCDRIMVAGRSTGQVQSSDSRTDLALLSVTPASTFASLRAGRLRQGEAITVVGYPLRGLLASGAQVTAGNVSALAGMQNDSRFIQISAPVQPGNSGGPLVDSSGNIVGVVVSKLNAVKMAQLTGDIPQNVNFAVSPLTLQGFLDANGVDYQTAPSNKSLSTADVADIAKKYTVLVECWK